MELSAQIRTVRGKANKVLRSTGVIPAELYGRGIPNVSLSVEEKAFRKVFAEAGENTVITLVVDGAKRSVLVHEVERDYLTSAVSHIDFHEVRMDEKIKAGVPIEFSGDAPAIKSYGGLINKAMTEIEVESLPGDLPREFAIDLSGLVELNQSIYVKDLAVPANVKVLVDPETVIVTVTPPMKEEEIAPAAEVDVSTVKVETEEKKQEREKEKEEGKSAA